MKVGDRVKVLPRCTKYGGKYNGKQGTVKVVKSWGFADTTPKSFGVYLDEEFNNRAAGGLFWFYQRDLSCEKEENNMLSGYEAVKIKFIDGGSREYTYALYPTEKPCLKGDLVVVQTGHHGLTLAQITEVDGVDVREVSFGRQVVSVVNRTAFQNRVAAEKRIAELRTAMAARARELQETTLYEVLAKEDDGLRAMLDEFKMLSGAWKEGDN